MTDRTPAVQAFSSEENRQLAHLVSDLPVIKDQLAKVAMVLDQLSQATLALREQAAKSDARFAEIKPVIDAMKVHVESFPHALREARRSDSAVQKVVEDLSARLRAVEAALNGRS